jgi:acyl-coenzyme A thioesterase PaaI-like protein
MLFNTNTSLASQILHWWETLSVLPGGNWLFSKGLGLLIPYTGSIEPLVLELRPGYAKVQIQDQKAVRNHLESVHAIALANLGEFVGGLATITQLQETQQAIVTELKYEFLKKARGTLTAEATANLPEIIGDTDVLIESLIRNEAGEVVTRCWATWKIRA